VAAPALPPRPAEELRPEPEAVRAQLPAASVRPARVARAPVSAPRARVLPRVVSAPPVAVLLPVVLRVWVQALAQERPQRRMPAPAPSNRKCIAQSQKPLVFSAVFASARQLPHTVSET
jgi:hypothetical protein